MTAVAIAGGGLALIASLYFLPLWERHRLPAILASALAANRRYLEMILTGSRTAAATTPS